jgi:hypothetical protein
MKANRRFSRIAALGALIPLALLAACSEKRVIPAPAPTQAPRPVPPPPRPAASDWRTAPQTPGDWAWISEGAQTVARFAGGKLTLRCDPAAGTIAIEQPATAAVPVPVTVQTSSLRRTLTGSPQAGASPRLVATLAARDPLLDAMVFSRGRFAIETPGLEPLYVPSWSEVGRVVQDCR